MLEQFCNLYDGLQIWATPLHQILCRPQNSFFENLGRICQFIDKYSLNRHQIFEWHARFETCWVSVQISEQSPENVTKRKINDFLNRSVDVQSVISLLLMTALSYGVSIAIIAWELSDKRKKKLVITVISDQWKLLPPFHALLQ